MKKQLVDYSLVSGRIYQNTYEALKRLIDNSYYSQLTHINHNDEKSYLKEFCTVRMCTSRQSGHTTAMCKIAKEYFDKVMFISPQYDMAERLNKCFQTIIYTQSQKSISENSEFTKVTKNEICTKNGYYFFGSQNSLEVFKGREAEAVFIDGSFALTSNKEDDIYMALGPCMYKYPQRFFVFIQ